MGTDTNKEFKTNLISARTGKRKEIGRENRMSMQKRDGDGN